MKRKQITALLAVLFLAVLTIGFPTMVKAQDGVEMGNGVAVTAEVVGIDRTDRTVALLGPEGNIVTVAVGPGARNFDKIQVGDKVNVVYYQSVVMSLGPKGEKPATSGGTVVTRAAKGDMPAGTIVETVDVSAKVGAINKEKRTVTLDLMDGRKVTAKVDESVQGFDKLKVGDTINARYTEAVAISVEKP